ncbi:Fc.00g037140.m01.CDS01 [Cosmosporella sp. VM-42]
MPSPSLLLAASLITTTHACSRINYKARIDDRILLGRSMDFVADTNNAIFAFPAGIPRNGGVDDNPLEWTSNGSITAFMYNQVYTEGINSESLAGSTLYPGGSEYGERDERWKGMFVGIWLQYFLDMYRTADEIISDICPQDSGKKFQFFFPKILFPALERISTSPSQMMEFTHSGTLNCYHSPDYTVMTNKPSFDQQLAINAYWDPIASEPSPAQVVQQVNRFARLSHYNAIIPPAANLERAASYTAGMIRAVNNPIIAMDPAQISTEDEWPTVWRMYEDIKDMIIFHGSATSPMLFYVEFLLFDLKKGAETKGLCKDIWTEC